jgi:hypothetical protein
VRPMPVHAPAPPARPFDLGTIPDAAIPVPPAKTSRLGPAPNRLETVSSENALYFADASGVRMFMDARAPLARVSAQGFVPLNPKP